MRRRVKLQHSGSCEGLREELREELGVDLLCEEIREDV